jgi:hypothetical protein
MEKHRQIAPPRTKMSASASKEAVTHVLYVWNVSSSDRDELKELFGTFRPLRMYIDDDHSLAEIEFEHAEDASEAMEYCDGVVIRHDPLLIDYQVREITAFSFDSRSASESSMNKRKAAFQHTFKLPSTRNGNSTSKAQPFLKKQLDDEMDDYWTRAKK